MEVSGRLPWSSNNGLVVKVTDGDEALGAVYKPLRGERPLWDYPPGLYRREAATFAVSGALGWDVVPATVVRDGPFGPGSFQLLVHARLEHQYFTLLEYPGHQRRLMAIAMLDLVVNSGDRKAGHFLLDHADQVWAIDNGLTFHVDPKLRTVVWDFGGRAMPEDLVADVARIVAEPPPALCDLVSDQEVEATLARAEALVDAPRFPVLRTPRDWPWPLV